MTVTGTEQRVYGTLVSKCLIDLHKLGFVLGSVDVPPNQEMDNNDLGYQMHIYADVPIGYRYMKHGKYCWQANYTTLFTSYYMCGMNYDGVVTINFGHIANGQWTILAVIEIRMCKRYTNRLVYETYGISTDPTIGNMPYSIWLNIARYDDNEPNWVCLNTGSADRIMEYKSESFVIQSPKTHMIYLPYQGIYNPTTLDISLCCTKCISPCLCGTCDKFYSRLKIDSKCIIIKSICCNYITVEILDTDYNSNITSVKINPKYGSILYLFKNIIIEYTLECNEKKMNIWAYFLKNVAQFTLYGEYMTISYYTEDLKYDIIYEGFSHLIGE